MKKKALIAMSGGVDSSVAAYLMKERGYDVIGVTMRLHRMGEQITDDEKSCCTTKDIEDAQKVAEHLGIPFHVCSFEDDFEEKVMKPFVSCYLGGMTPNPCVRCNRYMKFEALYKKAEELGCDTIVTGHYARITADEDGYHLRKGKDRSKDQSYVLYSLTQEQLSHIEFPLGEYTKEEIREIAESQHFLNAEKHDSQDICFIPDGDYRAFIERTTGRKSEPGDFVNTQGDIVGTHKGYYCYTIGQRKGLGIAAPAPYYVVDIIPNENKVILGSNEDLFKKELIASDFNWIEKNGPALTPLKARIRYHQIEKEASAVVLKDGKVAITFEEGQRAITKGQAVVLYAVDLVVGGGTIVGGIR